MEKKITVIKGDGIGPEIVTEAQKVLDKIAEKFGGEILTLFKSFLQFLSAIGKHKVRPIRKNVCFNQCFCAQVAMIIKLRYIHLSYLIKYWFIVTPS